MLIRAKWQDFFRHAELRFTLCATKEKTAQMGDQFNFCTILVPGVGLEPTSLAARDFKSRMYTSSIIRAYSISTTMCGLKAMAVWA